MRKQEEEEEKSQETECKVHNVRILMSAGKDCLVKKNNLSQSDSESPRDTHDKCQPKIFSCSKGRSKMRSQLWILTFHQYRDANRSTQSQLSELRTQVDTYSCEEDAGLLASESAV